MSTYTLPSPLDGVDVLWFTSGLFLATRERLYTCGPGLFLWVIVPPLPILFGRLQCVNKCGFIVASPRGTGPIFGCFGTCSIGVVIH